MAHEHAAATSIGEVAVIVSTADNVAVVKTAVEAGLALERPDGHVLTLAGAVTPGHRFATRSISRNAVWNSSSGRCSITSFAMTRSKVLSANGNSSSETILHPIFN